MVDGMRVFGLHGHMGSMMVPAVVEEAGGGLGSRCHTALSSWSVWLSTEVALPAHISRWKGVRGGGGRVAFAFDTWTAGKFQGCRV